jgi:outer membrane lipopolysaccharide assembly protein LptE/RlpB
MKSIFQKKALSYLLLPFCFYGCGYSFQGSGSILPEEIKIIAVRIPENNTTESGLSLRFAEKLRSRFERYGVVKVVDADKEADAELITKINKIDYKVRDVTGKTDVALDQELYMSFAAELRTKNGQILYQNDDLRVSESFASTSDVVVTSSSSFAQSGIGTSELNSLGDREVSRSQKEQALEEMMEEGARKLYLDSVAEDF